MDVWLKIDEFNSTKGTFKTWVLILAKYKALTYKRKLKKNQVEQIDDYQLEEPVATESQVIDRETQQKLLATIESFNDIDRELFIRRYYFNEKIEDMMHIFRLSWLAVDVFSMANVHNKNGHFFFVNAGNQPVITDSVSPVIFQSTFKRLAVLPRFVSMN